MAAELRLASAREQPVAQRLRFGVYEMDLRSGELWRSGLRVKIQKQPFKVLALLATHPGELLTREEIHCGAWENGVFVDFEQALNFCIRQIRSTLGDQAGTPRYVETLPRRGYRFIAPVEFGTTERGGAGSLAGGWAPAQPVAEVEPPAAEVMPPVARVARAMAEVEPPLAAPSRRSVPGRGGRRFALGSVLLGALLAAVWTLVKTIGSGPEPTFQRLTFRTGYVTSARFGPRGRVLYAGAWDAQDMDVYSVSLDDLSPRSLGARLSRFDRIVGVSPRGEVGLLSRRGEVGPLSSSSGHSYMLRRMRSGGGPSKAVLENVSAADWSSDGTAFAVARKVGQRSQIEFPIGRVLCEAGRVAYVKISPSRERIAFVEQPVHMDDRGHVVVVDSAGTVTKLTDDWGSVTGLGWAPDESEVWFSAARVGADAGLQAVSLSGEQRTLVSPFGRLALLDVAKNGQVLLSRTAMRLELRYFRDDDAAERDISWLDFSGLQALSADGTRVLFFESGEGADPGYSIFLRDARAPSPVQVGTGRPLSLSPDGRWVVAAPLDVSDELHLLPTGPGERRVIRTTGLADYTWAGFLPDGHSLLVNASLHGAPRRAHVLPLSDGEPRPMSPEGVQVPPDGLSPDGKRMVVACEQSKCLQTLGDNTLRPIPGLGARDQFLGWARANAIYVHDWNVGSAAARVYRLNLETGERSLWRTLGPEDSSGIVKVSRVRITPDGTAYAYSFARMQSELYLVDNVR